MLTTTSRRAHDSHVRHQGPAIKLGIAIFPADFAIRPDELARAVEEWGFESLFLTDHTHIPATPQTRKLMAEAQGGVLPHFTHNYDPFVALTYAAAATQTLRLGTAAGRDLPLRGPAPDHPGATQPGPRERSQAAWGN